MIATKSTLHDKQGDPNTDSEPVWLNGEILYPLYSMETKHIINAYKKYQRKNNTYAAWSWQNKYREFWIKEFENELAARENEITRHPTTNQFLSIEELFKQRAMRRVLLNLPAMKPRVDIEVEHKEPEVSIFAQIQ